MHTVLGYRNAADLRRRLAHNYHVGIFYTLRFLSRLDEEVIVRRLGCGTDHPCAFVAGHKEDKKVVLVTERSLTGEASEAIADEWSYAMNSYPTRLLF